MKHLLKPENLGSKIKYDSVCASVTHILSKNRHYPFCFCPDQLQVFHQIRRHGQCDCRHVFARRSLYPPTVWETEKTPLWSFTYRRVPAADPPIKKSESDSAGKRNIFCSRIRRQSWVGGFFLCRHGCWRRCGSGWRAAAPPVPVWTVGCTAGRPGRSCGWRPGPYRPGSWSPLGCWRCSSWGHSGLQEVDKTRELGTKGEVKKKE